MRDLLSAINNCLQTGEFPSRCKVSKVIPVYKKGNKSEPGNYRPISLTSIFSKVLEKVIKNRLTQFLQLSKNQYGFQKGSSTQSAAVDLIQTIVTKLEEKKNVIVVFVDLKKAFDTVKHDVLLMKLKRLGIRGPAHRLISSFLSGRTQYTVLEKEKSDTRIITTGVPQGSVLGPLLYLLYVESLSRAGLKAEHYMFADDTALVYSGKDVCRLEQLINKDLTRFLQWLRAGGLVINEQKTVCMHFHQKNRIITPINLVINITPVKQVNCHRYLGLVIDNKLTWDKHIDDIVGGRLCGLIGALRRINHLLTVKCRYMLYNAYVQSALSYLTAVWANLSVFNLSRLKRFQNKSIKAIFNIPYYTKTVELYSCLPIMPLNKLRQLELCKMIYKIKNKKIKTNINLNINSDKHSYQTRGADNISTARIRTSKGFKSPIYQGCKYYNGLPKNLRDLEDYDQFVKNLKRYLNGLS